MKMLLLIALLFLLVLLADLFIERFLLLTRCEIIPLKELPREFDGLRILQISDLHHRTFGKDNSRIIKRVQKIKPDLIAITGDLVSRDQRDFTAIGRFCKALTDTAPVYFVPGNHELDLPAKVQETYLKTLQGAGVIVLQNTSRLLKKGKGILSLTGTTLDTSVYRDAHFRYDHLNPFSKEELVQLIGERQRCTVLLAHNPLIAQVYADWHADLVLSGHVHGGVVQLPFIGGVLSPERKFFPRYSKGLYRIGCTKLYVSAGLGKLRLWNPPEIHLLTLRIEL